MPLPTSDAERMSVLQDSLLCRLKLANIQRCQVNFGCEPSCRFFLDFLLPSKSTLSEIRTSISSDDNKYVKQHDELVDKQIIKFVGIEEKMAQRSNIAIELPQLRNLTVTVRYTGMRFIYYIQPNDVIKVEKVY